METLDLKKQWKSLYQPSAKAVELVEVPCFQTLSIEGELEPGVKPGDSPLFIEAVQALYGLAYTLKFASKLRKENPIDYPVMPLEGLWWMDGGVLDLQKPDGWKFNLLILQPDHISPALFGEALEKLRKKKPSPALDRLRLAAFSEGLCVQILHLGPYAEEMRTLALMAEFATAQGYRMCGKHHEIYLSDPFKSKPERLKTILRHPVER